METKIKDIFKGEFLQICDDGEFVTLALGLVTIALTKEEWEDFKKDIEKLSDM